MAETFSTSLFSLFGNKVNILTLTVPNVLENNLIIKRTNLQSDNVSVYKHILTGLLQTSCAVLGRKYIYNMMHR